MYIIKKLVSTARPDTKRVKQNVGTVLVNMVAPLPSSAIILAKIRTGRRPTLSAMAPNVCVPTTEPMKNIDWPIVDFHASSHTQFSCEWKIKIAAISFIFLVFYSVIPRGKQLIMRLFWLFETFLGLVFGEFSSLFETFSVFVEPEVATSSLNVTLAPIIAAFSFSAPGYAEEKSEKVSKSIKKCPKDSQVWNIYESLWSLIKSDNVRTISRSVAHPLCCPIKALLSLYAYLANHAMVIVIQIINVSGAKAFSTCFDWSGYGSLVCHFMPSIRRTMWIRIFGVNLTYLSNSFVGQRIVITPANANNTIWFLYIDCYLAHQMWKWKFEIYSVKFDARFHLTTDQACNDSPHLRMIVSAAAAHLNSCVLHTKFSTPFSAYNTTRALIELSDPTYRAQNLTVAAFLIQSILNAVASDIVTFYCYFSGVDSSTTITHEWTSVHITLIQNDISIIVIFVVP